MEGGGLSDELVPVAGELRLPTELKLVTGGEVKGAFTELALNPEGEASFFRMAQELARARGVIGGMGGDFSDAEKSELRGTLVFVEWGRVMDMRFTVKELDYIVRAQKMLEESGAAGNFIEEVRAYRQEVLRSPGMKLPEELIRQEVKHGDAVGDTAGEEFKAGRLGFFGLMAAEFHDCRKVFPPVNDEEGGRMWLWSHEMASAVAARVMAGRYFEMRGFGPEEAKLLARWVEFAAAHHGFAEFPMNMAVSSQLVLDQKGEVNHMERVIPVRAVVVSGPKEVYGVVRNEEVLGSLPEELGRDVEAVRAIDNADGMMPGSFPKYVNGTSQATFGACGDMGDLACGSFGRTFVLNGRDGGVMLFPDMAAGKAEGFLMSGVLIAAFGANLDQDRKAFGMLEEITMPFGKNMGGVIFELAKKAQEGFAEWKTAVSKGESYEKAREKFSLLLDSVVTDFSMEWKGAKVGERVDAMKLLYGFVEEALAKRMERVGEGRKLGLPENLYVPMGFDEGHFQQGVRELIWPAVEGRIKKILTDRGGS